MTLDALAPLGRDQTATAYEKHLVAKGNYTGAWDTLADLFAADARYHDVFYGWMHGREAIRDFLRQSMKGIEHWSFPVQWTVVSEGRVVVQWLNRLPGGRPDGTHYEFPGVSTIAYGADGLITEQMDFYDGIAAIKVVIEARTGFLGRAVRKCFGWIGPASREALRALYTLFDANNRGALPAPPPPAELAEPPPHRARTARQ